MRFSINTLGCKVNLCESDGLSRMLLDKGFQQVDYKSGKPHISIINTCTVTAESDRKVRQLVRKIKKANNQARLVITGCYVKDHYGFLKNIGSDLIIGNEEKKDLRRMSGIILDLVKDDMADKNREKSGRKNNLHSRPIVKIQDGCEQDCAYCIIPRVRGRYCSTPESSILETIDYFSGEGYGEAVLTGIHIGKYGVDMGGGKDLSCLLEKIFVNTGIGRIRISSVEINEINDGLLDIMQKYHKRIAPHLHIPLQSGSDNILRKMGRPYTSSLFRNIADEIVGRFPGIALSTDIMAGFPGESEKDFEKTLELVREIGFSKLHVFKYSPRPMTRAYYFEDKVPPGEKTERSRVLRELGGRMRQDFLEENTGKILEVAVETLDPANNIISGTSGNYIKVYFKKDSKWGKIRGRIIKVRTEKKYLDGLLGTEAV